MATIVKRKALKRRKGGKLQAAVILGARGGVKGGPARARALTPAQRTKIARLGGKARMRNVHKARSG